MLRILWSPASESFLQRERLTEISHLTSVTRLLSFIHPPYTSSIQLGLLFKAKHTRWLPSKRFIENQTLTIFPLIRNNNNYPRRRRRLRGDDTFLNETSFQDVLTPSLFPPPRKASHEIVLAFVQRESIPLLVDRLTDCLLGTTTMRTRSQNLPARDTNWDSHLGSRPRTFIPFERQLFQSRVA